MAGGVHSKGIHGRGHVWLGGKAGDKHGRGHVWQGACTAGG